MRRQWGSRDLLPWRLTVKRSWCQKDTFKTRQSRWLGCARQLVTWCIIQCTRNWHGHASGRTKNGSHQESRSDSLFRTHVTSCLTTMTNTAHCGNFYITFPAVVRYVAEKVAAFRWKQMLIKKIKNKNWVLEPIILSAGQTKLRATLGRDCSTFW